MENKRIIQVDEKVPVKLLIPLSIQHMFAMFGASVLVPFVLGINPAIVLFMNGLGTLLFILITKGRAPAYLGSSFAFLAPAGIVISKWGYDYALGCFVAVGFCGCVLALIIYKFGSEWINVVLPPAAMGNPECDFMTWQRPSDKKCPECGSVLLHKGNKLVCMNETCGFVMANPKEEDQ